MGYEITISVPGENKEVKIPQLLEGDLIPDYHLKNFRKNGIFETYKYNLNFNEIKSSLNFLEEEIQERNEILQDNLVEALEINDMLSNKLQHLQRKHKFIKERRFRRDDTHTTIDSNIGEYKE